MKQKTVIVDASNDDRVLFTLDYLYAPHHNTFKYKWQDDGHHSQQYIVVGCEEEIETLNVTRFLYVLPANQAI